MHLVLVQVLPLENFARHHLSRDMFAHGATMSNEIVTLLAIVADNAFWGWCDGFARLTKRMEKFRAFGSSCECHQAERRAGKVVHCEAAEGGS